MRETFGAKLLITLHVNKAASRHEILFTEMSTLDSIFS